MTQGQSHGSPCEVELPAVCCDYVLYEEDGCGFGVPIIDEARCSLSFPMQGSKSKSIGLFIVYFVLPDSSLPASPE